VVRGEGLAARETSAFADAMADRGQEAAGSVQTGAWQGRRGEGRRGYGGREMPLGELRVR
jgi:hypothetical protein